MTNKDSPDSYGPIPAPILLPPPPLTRYLAFRSLRFFESPSIIPKKKWHWYRTRFKQRSTRHDMYELRTKNLQRPGDNEAYYIGFKLYNPDGTTMNFYEYKVVISGLWEGSLHQAGCGWDDPGYWPLGTYRVEVFIDGALFGKRSFTIK
jgi:hypothetical protein